MSNLGFSVAEECIFLDGNVEVGVGAKEVHQSESPSSALETSPEPEINPNVVVWLFFVAWV